jgi:hypothetical protein
MSAAQAPLKEDRSCCIDTVHLGYALCQVDARDPLHPCRQGLSRPQPPAQIPRLDQRPGAPRHRHIRREMRRRAAVEPVIGHLKAEHRMDRNYLKGRDGDRINAILAAAGYNFGLLLRWLAEILSALATALFHTPATSQTA